MSESSKKTLISIVVGACIVTGVYLLLMAYKNSNVKDDSHLKNYKVNEYIPTYISDEAMARIYLNDFVSVMYSDVVKAYNLIDSDYRTKKFGNINNFKKYISSLKFTSYSVNKYYKNTTSDGAVVYGIYDENNNLFIFKTKGVLQYSVFLDDYTVEIW